MITVEEARRLATAGLEALPGVRVPLADALGRAAHGSVAATRALPGFDNSSMDGFAVRHADLAAGTPLKIVVQIPAGVVADRAIGPGQAARIFTGAPMPDGADTVVIQEDTIHEGGTVHVHEAPAPGANIRRRGEDIDLGELVVAGGQVLTAGRLAMLAAQGHREVGVGRRPRVAIVPNGDELVPIDAHVGPGQVPNTNAHMLAAQVSAAGGEPWPFDPVADNPDAVAHALRVAADGADLVLTTGGMSVGDFDYARDALNADGDLSFYKVRLKPGKPLGLGWLGGTPVLGLPGNPVSAFVGFELFGRAMLRTLAGFREVDHPEFEGVLASEVRPNRSRPEFIRCDVDGVALHPWPKQGSGMISSLLHADALALIPAGVDPLPVGARVKAVDLRR